MKVIIQIIAAVSMMSMVLFAQADCTNTFGRVERVTLYPEKLTLSAKLDTGAKTASLNAIDIKPYTVKGNTWVEFTVVTKQAKMTFKRKLHKYVKIKMRANEARVSTAGTSVTGSAVFQQRPEILMRVKLGNQEKVILVDLTNRSTFIYPLLLGRDAIATFQGCVDPAKVRLTTHGAR